MKNLFKKLISTESAFGILIAILGIILLVLIDKYLINISDLLIGWIGCVCYYAGKDAHRQVLLDKINNNNRTNP